MKIVMFTALVLVIFALIFPVVTAYRPDKGDKQPSEPDATPDGEGDTNTDTPSPSPSPSAAVSDSSVTLRLLDAGEVREITLFDYLKGSLAAEMPASFEPEALRAQAVALRTYLLYKLRVNPSSAHPDADICSDSSCCAAWKSDDFLREKWGGDFESFSDKISSAVSSTDGVYISYGGEPALAVFHSSSAGRTEDSGRVWNNSLPYLVSVESPESAEDVPNFISTVTVTREEFSSAVKEKYPQADFSGDTDTWIGVPVYSESGRLISIALGGADVTGTSLRSMFSLRSTAVTITMTDDGIEMTTRGYGHGVGMSQYGANVMARDGAGYEEILAAYYPGTDLAENRGE